MLRRAAIVLGGVAVLGTLVAPVAAAGSSNAGCWGQVTSQRAVALHDMGEHSSSFAPGARLGLANVARAVLGDDATLGDLGAALGSLDGIDATHCP